MNVMSFCLCLALSFLHTGRTAGITEYLAQFFESFHRRFVNGITPLRHLHRQKSELGLGLGLRLGQGKGQRGKERTSRRIRISIPPKSPLHKIYSKRIRRYAILAQLDTHYCHALHACITIYQHRSCVPLLPGKSCHLKLPAHLVA